MSSKSILGGRNTINIGSIDFQDGKFETMTLNELTANRGIATDSNKKLVSTTATDTEINYLSGVSSAIQTQLNAKQATIADGDLSIAKTSGLQTALDSKQPTIADGDLSIAKTSGLQTALNSKQATIGDGDLTIARTSGLQTALDAKQPTITAGTNLSFNGTTLNAANQVPNITASRVAVSDTNGDLTASSITTTELDFLDGVSSGIQSQLNAKQATITAGTNLSFNGTTLNATADGLPLPAGVIGGTQPCLLLYNQTGDTMTQQQNIEVSNSGIKLVGSSNGLACGGASLSGGNVETTGACNAVGGFNATNGGITVSGAVDCASVVASGNIKCSGTFLNSSNQNILSGLLSSLDNQRTLNSNRSHGETRILVNTISDSDNGGVEGQPRSQFTVNMRTRRSSGYTLTENKMRIECGHAGDNDGRRDNMTFRGQFYSNSTYLLSDDRAKFDEVALSNAMNIVNQIQVYTYTKYTSPIREDLARPTDEDGKMEIGVIAQEIEAIPELSHTVSTVPIFDDEVIAKKTVNYAELFCVAIEAIKELKAEVDTLNQRIAVLEG